MWVLRTWGDALARRPALLAQVILLVLVLDVRAAVHLRQAGAHTCAEAGLPSATHLDVALRMTQPALRPGQEATGTAIVTNRGRRTVVLVGAKAVLVAPGTHQPVTWAAAGTLPAVDLRPGTYASVPFVVHLTRCKDRRGAPLVPGFYEVELVLTEQQDGKIRNHRSPSTAVVLSP